MAKIDSFNKGIKNAEAAAFQAAIKKAKDRKPVDVMAMMGLSKTASVEK